MTTYRYSQWDGTQQGIEPDADDLMDALSDEIMEHGDLSRALRELMQRGMKGGSGQRLKGLQEMINRLRQQRKQTLNRYNLDSTVQDIKNKLDGIVAKERAGIERRLQETVDRGKEGGQNEAGLKALERVAQKKKDFLDQLPQDLGGAIKSLSSYDFMDGEARQEFQELMDSLKKHMADSLMKDVSQNLQNITPEQMARFKDMLKQLNQMLSEKMKGGNPDFQNFMKQFGDMFGGEKPRSLDELMDMLNQRMAQAQSLMNSLSPQQQDSLKSLLSAMVDQHGLGHEMAELARHMAEMFPQADQGLPYPFRGDESLTLDEALRLIEQLQEMDGLEKQLQAAREGSPLEDIDSQKLKELLGEEAHRNLEQWKKMLEALEKSGYIHKQGQNLELTPRAMRRIGQKALRDIFSLLRKDRQGRHEISKSGAGGDLSDETKSYEFGDPFFLHLERTLMKAVHRAGSGTPVKLEAGDFEVFRTEQSTRCATALLIDLSWSMPMRGNFLPAKKMTLALESLIHSQFPRDTLYIIGFSDYARELSSDMLTNLTWNEYVYGTNMQHAFILARRLLSKHKSGNRQIIMVTDGEPTAHLEGGEAYFAYPPHPRTLQLTLLEAKHCARSGITINSFVLDRTYQLMQFMDEMAKVSKGRVFYSTSDRLGEYVLVDFLSNKRRRIKG